MPELRLALLAATLAVACVLYLTLGARGDWNFVLAFRGRKQAALLLVGTAIAVATVMFQTVAGNRILTPPIIGFDALFVLLQTSLVFFIGGLGLASLATGT